MLELFKRILYYLDSGVICYSEYHLVSDPIHGGVLIATPDSKKVKVSLHFIEIYNWLIYCSVKGEFSLNARIRLLSEFYKNNDKELGI